MKLLKPGRDQKGWSAELVCTGEGNGGGGCGATLLVEQADVYQTSSGHYDGSVDYFASFDCMACGVTTDLKERVPFEVQPKRKPR